MPSRSPLITLEPAVLRWARERARLNQQQLGEKMHVKPARISEWERSGKISFSQVENIAHHTHTPLGFLYLPEPPDGSLPIADFRTRSHDIPKRPSPDLLETVYQMQRRQLWMRDELIEWGAEQLSFVGIHAKECDPAQTAVAMRNALQLEQDWASHQPNWSAALGHLRDQAEAIGVLVIFNGIVGNNTRRKLDPEEFQGFALVDEYAPLVFVNRADFRAAQMFTFAHELAHILIGTSGVSKFENLQPPSHAAEQLSNRIAAEFLVSENELRDFWQEAVSSSEEPFQSVARRFKVSSLVAARRAFDLELIQKEAFFRFYNEEGSRRRASDSNTSGGGGDFWNTQKWRIGSRFATAVVRATRGGRLSYREAYSLTNLEGNTFDNIPEKMGLAL